MFDNVLVLILVAILVLAVIGHGIWLVLAAMFGALFGTWSSPGKGGRAFIAGQICPRCSEAWPRSPANAACPVCSFNPSLVESPVTPRTASLLFRLTRRFERYGRLGLLPGPMVEQLQAAVHPERVAVAVPAAARVPSAETDAPKTARPAESQQAPHQVPTELPVPARPPIRPTPASLVPVEKREPVPSIAAAPPPKPRPEPVSQMLATFFEAKNIRWGELVGGLIVVGCSVALVLSFWSSIAERPFLKYGLFLGVTAGLFGLGLHAERRWKLPTTALGLLSIGALLIPLNCLAIASFEHMVPVRTLGGVAGQLVAVGVCGGLLLAAGRHLVPHAWYALLPAVLVPSGLVFLVPDGLAKTGSTLLLLALGALPALGQGLGLALLDRRQRRAGPLKESTAWEFVGLTGLSCFAVSIGIGLLLVRSGPLSSSVHALAPIVPVLGAPLLLAGLSLWRRSEAPDLTAWRTTGAALAAAGSLILLGGIACAWPEPRTLIPAAGLAALVFSALAIGFAIPAGHLLAGLAASVAYLVLVGLWCGPLSWQTTDPATTWEALVSSRSGAALLPAALAFAAGSWSWSKRGRHDDAQIYGLLAGLAAVVSLGLVSWFSWGRSGDPGGAAWVYAAYALLAYLALVVQGWGISSSPRQRSATREILAVAATGLALLAVVQAVVHGHPIGLATPWIASLLLHAVLATGAARLLVLLDRPAQHSNTHPENVLSYSAIATSTLAVALILLAIPLRSQFVLMLDTTVVAAVWTLMAWTMRSRWLALGAHLAALGAVLFGAASVLARHPDFLNLEARWLDPWAMTRLGWAAGAFAIVSIGAQWGLARLVAARPEGRTGQRLAELVETPVSVDHGILLGLAALVVVLAVYAVVPGVAQELLPRSFAATLAKTAIENPLARIVPPVSVFEWPGIDHHHAAGGATWLLLGLVVAGLLARQWLRFSRSDLTVSLAVAMMAAFLLAVRWESTQSVASALRWTTTLGLLAGSLLVWNRDRLGGLASRWGWSLASEAGPSDRTSLVATLLALMLLPLVGMAVFLAVTGLQQHVPGSGVQTAWMVSALVFTGLAALLVFWGRIEPGASGPSWQRQVVDRARPVLAMLLSLSTFALLAISVHVVGQALSGDPIVGPAPGRFFDRIGPVASYVPPIVLVALVLAGYAVRERSAGFAFAAGLVGNIAATTGYVLAQPPTASFSDAALWVGLAQVNAITSGVVAWLWQGGFFLAGRMGKRRATADLPLLSLTIDLAVVLTFLPLLAGTLLLWVTPLPSSLHQTLTGPLGWIALGLLLSLLAVHPRAAALRSLDAGHALLLAFTTFLAFNLARSDSGDWRTYHAMLVAPLAAALASLGLAWHFTGLRLGTMRPENRAVAVRWATVALMLVIAFALRGYFADPTSRWWEIGALAGVVPLAVVLAVWYGSGTYLGIAAALVNLAASLAFFDWPWPGMSRAPLLDLVHLNALALAAPVPVWLWIAWRWLRGARDLAGGAWSRVPAVASWLALALLAGVTAITLSYQAGGLLVQPVVLLSAGAIAASALAFLIRMRTGSLSGCVFGLYLVGLCAVGWGVNQAQPPTAMLPWLGSILLAAYTLTTSYLWSRRSGLHATADRFGLIAPGASNPGEVHAWLIPANVLLAAGVLALAVLTVVSEPNGARRLLSGKAALSQALAIGLLARGERRSVLQKLALGLLVVGAGVWAWAWVDPTIPGCWLDRLALGLAVAAGATVLYGIGLVKWLSPRSEWARAACSLTPGLTVAGSALLVVTLGVECHDWLTSGLVALSPLSILTIGLVLCGLPLACLTAALVPGRDPFALSERGRTAYVYAAELLLALLVLHLRMTVPWLFGGWVAQYWSLLILGVAFLGVGLSEVFRRQGRAVLAEPLERSGALLPVLPLLAAFWTPPRPGLDSFYLVLAGALYGLASFQRRSAGYGALAALAFNAALWTVLGRWQGFGLAEHPQLWVIPPALCVLAAGFLTRDRLTEAQQASLRYGAALAIYLSSTADIVLTGVKQAPWLPLVLGALALGGIFLGILLRIRGFLMLGLGFLGLALFSMIWFAAVDLHQTWLWWASGIVVGCLILALFALFEKKRLEVLQVLHQMKGWSP